MPASLSHHLPGGSHPSAVHCRRAKTPRTAGSRLVATAASVLLLSSAPQGLTAQDARIFDSELHDYRVVTVVDDLQDPWSMAFLPSGEMLVTERIGQLRMVRDGVLDPDPIAGIPEVRYQGQGGLLDVTLHPDFEANQLIYLSYSKPNEDRSEATTAVSRGRLVGMELQDVEEIFEAQAWGPGGSHFGSRLVFDH
jgi:aldose sugar dehydrogenase